MDEDYMEEGESDNEECEKLIIKINQFYLELPNGEALVKNPGRTEFWDYYGWYF